MELYSRVSDTPTAMEAVYEYVLVAAGDAFTEAEVSAALDLPKTTTHVALGALVAEGLVVQEHVGRTGRYSVDPTDPLTRHNSRSPAPFGSCSKQFFRSVMNSTS